jgi:hypothetical protein
LQDSAPTKKNTCTELVLQSTKDSNFILFTYLFCWSEKKCVFWSSEFQSISHT